MNESEASRQEQAFMVIAIGAVVLLLCIFAFMVSDYKCRKRMERIEKHMQEMEKNMSGIEHKEKDMENDQ